MPTPPGRFLYFHLHLLINKIGSKKTRKPNRSFSENKPHKSFSLREENTLPSRAERFLLAKRIVYLREGNEEHSHRTRNKCSVNHHRRHYTTIESVWILPFIVFMSYFSVYLSPFLAFLHSLILQG